MPETGVSSEEKGALEAPVIDIREKGRGQDGLAQYLDRRLFLDFLAFGGCASSVLLIRALKSAKIPCVLYHDLHDPRGVGLLSFAEDPGFFAEKLRDFLAKPPFRRLVLKPEYSFLGRTYALGYEPNLEDWLLRRPRRVLGDSAWPWAVWYPLRRTGAFAALPMEEQGRILKEHAAVGRAFGSAGLGQDIRLACQGLDRSDNDFVIGLAGQSLHPLSALVAAMRRTKQTSSYIQSMGPFFVGKAVYQGASHV